VLCPIIAAALFVLAGLYGWSRRLTDEYRALEQAERDVTELHNHCTRTLAGLPAAAPPTRSAPTTALARVGTVILLTVTLLGGAACNGQAQASAPLPVTIPSTPPAAAPSAAGGELWLDDTISIDQRDRPIAVEAVLATVTDLFRQQQIDRWAIFGFGDEPWREAPFHQVTLARWQPPACDPPSEASKIFKVHQDDAACRARVQAAEQAYREQLRAQLAETQQAIADHQLRPARCTNLGDLLLRVSQTPGRRLTVIVSDGAETCRSTGLPRVAPPSADAHVVFVLIGSAPRAGHIAPPLGTQFGARRDTLLRAAPWLRIVAPWELPTALRQDAATQ
jgi:hypothetical protein